MENNKIMTHDEANEIFKFWQDWFYPFHLMLDSIFFGCQLPESLLPYPIKTIEEALNIVAEDFHNKGNIQASQNIQETMAFALGSYAKNEDAWEGAAKWFSDPKMMSVRLASIERFKKEFNGYISWLKKQK